MTTEAITSTQMNHRAGEQLRVNSVVPFPYEQIHDSPGDAEKFFITLSHRERLLPYESFPEALSSNGIDAYLTWLASLTKADSFGRERGAFLHFDTSKSRLIYPSNPYVGTSTQAIAIAGSGRKFLPIMRAHSHPDATCFSAQDLKRVAGDPRFIAEGLGTQTNNLLLLRSEETKLYNDDKAVEIMEQSKTDIEKLALAMHDLPDVLLERGDLTSQDEVNSVKATILDAECKEFTVDFGTYFFTYARTHALAKILNLGFYVSKKEGIFKKFTDEMLSYIENRGQNVRNDIMRRLVRADSGELMLLDNF